MASFVQNLWESIFTPGPTPSLLRATNISFAALQTVLAVLLLATYSIHFVILSFLCGGLWWAINWFATELKASQEREEAKKRRLAQEIRVTDDSETEVEPATISAPKASGSSEVEPVEPRGEMKLRAAELSGTQSSASTEDEWEKVSESENDKDK